MADEPINIVYEASGFDDLERGAGKAAKSADDLAAALESANRWADEGHIKLGRWASEAARIAQELDKVNSLMRRAPSYASGSNFATAPNGGGGGGSGSGGRGYVGPYQRLDRLNDDYARAAQMGAGASKMKDLDYARGLAQSRVDKLENPKGAMGKVFDAVLSSRFGFSGGKFNAMPLVGRSLGAVGVGGAAAGPVGLAVTAAVALAEAMKALSDQTAQVTREFSDLKNTTGGTGAEAARLKGVGGAIGLGPGEIAGLSRAISERIASDGTAAGFAGRFGVTATPGPYGTLDTAGNTLKIIQGLRAITDQQDRLRTARGLGAEALLPAANLSDGTLNKVLGSDARVTERVNNPEQVRRAAEYQASLARMQQATDNLLASLSGPLMDDLTATFNRVADLMNMAADFASRFKPVLDFLYQQNKNLVNGPMKGLFDIGKLAQAGGGGQSSASGGDDHAYVSVMVENSRAVVLNTDALTRLRGMIGGGERSRGALPSALRGENLVRAMEVNAIGLGTL